MAAKKTTRKAAAKKKPRRRKKAASKKVALKKARSSRSAIDLVGRELPRSLRVFGSQLRRDLNAIEKQIETAGRDTRRGLARIVRDASHQLGILEARGQREWRSLSRNAQRDLERVMKRVRKATGV